MKIKNGFVIEKVAESYLACATGELAEKFSGFIRLNETGAFLWSKLAERDMTKEELVSSLRSEYDVTEEIAERDVAAFILALSNNGIIE